MNKDDNAKMPAAGETGSENLPFVNEECGDTMWDAVIKEAEERLREVMNPKDQVRYLNKENKPIPTKH